MKSGSSPCAPRYFELPASADRPGLAARAEIAAAARNTRSAAGIGAGELRDHPLHRPARRELHHDEGDEQDAEQRRDHQQNAAGDIGAHGLFRLLELGGLGGVVPPDCSGAPTPCAIARRLLRMVEHIPIGDRVRRRDTIAAPNSARRETPGRAPGRRWSDPPAFRRRWPFRSARRSRDWRRPRDCTIPWWRPPATRRYGRRLSPGVADMLKRWIVMSKSKSSTRARYCTASISRMPASIPSVAEILDEGRMMRLKRRLVDQEFDCEEPRRSAAAACRP